MHHGSSHKHKCVFFPINCNGEARKHFLTAETHVTVSFRLFSPRLLLNGILLDPTMYVYLIACSAHTVRPSMLHMLEVDTPVRRTPLPSEQRSHQQWLRFCRKLWPRPQSPNPMLPGQRPPLRPPVPPLTRPTLPPTTAQQRPALRYQRKHRMVTPVPTPTAGAPKSVKQTPPLDLKRDFGRPSAATSVNCLDLNLTMCLTMKTAASPLPPTHSHPRLSFWC
jgi:hypothetical protein